MTTDQKKLENARQYCPTLTLRKVTEEGALLVDVREPSEIATLAFDVPKLVAIPMSEFEQRFMELPRDQELILACSVGERSLKATYFLMYHGYDNVGNMESGLTKWVRKCFPVKGDAESLTNGSACCTSSSPPGKCC
ncbi:MAG: rhodanese-like domain-containing protein [Novosphingobium sp.]|nr:rhodanese-like domain-containing protein [Novosphingobium sp.]HPE61517.1 rhodanese-like domain-containing protein [Thiolinea sp.]